MRSTPGDVELVELEPESPSIPATKQLKSITGRPAPSTIRSIVRPIAADRKRPSADTQQEEVVIPKQRRSDLELMYDSEDDEPITSRARIFNRLVSSSSSSDVESKEHENKNLSKSKENAEFDSKHRASMKITTHTKIYPAREKFYTFCQNLYSNTYLNRF
ncbi:unnamed protein product [Trichogramma brassicae]|uniref:Uncharacterized protein n=1 Tax=Trichogramma brassicae TaxID=86971 RepID=A0A6H5I5C3_9HYME|nr:unnamed protein product [Trichogramma brassicae]